MLDAHVHIERGPYTLAWIREFTDQAVRMGLDRLYLLEHSHNFVEFAGIYRRYYEIMKSLVQSGLFTHLAHPESIKCFGFRPGIDMRGIYREIAAAAAERHVKVEFNNGLRINYGLDEPGLSHEFAARLLREGAEVLTASDAHRPEDVGKYVRESAALMAAGIFDL